MPRITKRDKTARNLDRLCGLFGVPHPRLGFGSCGCGVNGLYWHGGRFWTGREYLEKFPCITIDPKVPGAYLLELLAHEFAHHLDAVRDGVRAEPPASLPEVRVAIAGESMRHTMLAHDALGRVPAEWL